MHKFVFQLFRRNTHSGPHSLFFPSGLFPFSAMMGNVILMGTKMEKKPGGEF